MSAQDLANKCSDLGYPMVRSIIANLESGRRTTVTVAEITIFAHALDVPLPALISETESLGESVEMLPGSLVSRSEALLWSSGERLKQLVNTDDREEGLAQTLIERIKLAGEIWYSEHRALREMKRFADLEADTAFMRPDDFKKKHGFAPSAIDQKRQEFLRAWLHGAIQDRWRLFDLGGGWPPLTEDASNAYAAAGLSSVIDALNSSRERGGMNYNELVGLLREAHTNGDNNRL